MTKMGDHDAYIPDPIRKQRCLSSRKARLLVADDVGDTNSRRPSLHQIVSVRICLGIQFAAACSMPESDRWMSA